MKREGGYVVLTCDLDFSALLATSGAIITIDELAARVRILPIRRQPVGEGPG